MYILYERKGDCVLKRKGERISERKIMVVVKSNINNRFVTQTIDMVVWSSSFHADQEFPKPTGSSNNLTDLSGNYRWE